MALGRKPNPVASGSNAPLEATLLRGRARVDHQCVKVGKRPPETGDGLCAIPSRRNDGYTVRFGCSSAPPIYAGDYRCPPLASGSKP